MTGSEEWEDEWTRDADAILALVRSKNGRFREFKDEAIWCHCHKPGTRVVRYFAGPDASGEQRRWMLVPKRRRGGTGRGTIPAKARPFPRHGEMAWTMVAECDRCKQAWVLFPAGKPDLEGDGIGRYIVTNADPKNQPGTWTEQDRTEVRRIVEWLSPGLLGLENMAVAVCSAPTHGRVATD